ncbi:MAG: type II toxin-antitoxin system HicA family toxin [Chthonomonadales bacterium]
MTKLPDLKGHEVVSALQRAGFEVIRVKGSHHFLRHPDGRCTVVPVHRGETIGPGLMFKILRDCEMTREELVDLL